MAKKDPTDLSVEEKLKTLYQLQAALSSIDEKRALRGELPLEVQDLEDEIEGLTTRVEKIKNEIDEFQRAITQKTGEMHYHQYFGYEQQIQICVIGHYQSEQYTAELFRDIIERECSGVQTFIAETNTNPIFYV